MLNPHSFFTAAILAGVLTLTSGAAQAQTAKPALTLKLANHAAGEAIAACAKKGAVVSVAVLDAAGLTLSVQTADGASAGGVTGASRKALTAFNLKMTTSDVAAHAADPAVAAQLSAHNEYVTWPGGLLIKHGDAIVGAIGVGGASDGAVDEQCAKVALDLLEKKLQ